MAGGFKGTHLKTRFGTPRISSPLEVGKFSVGWKLDEISTILIQSHLSSLPIGHGFQPVQFSRFQRNDLSQQKRQTCFFTPWKINIEPTHHPFRKENDLPNLHDYVPC